VGDISLPINGTMPVLTSSPVLFDPPFSLNPIYDLPMWRAAQLYEERVNASGGIRLPDGSRVPLKLSYFNVGPNLSPTATLAEKALYLQRGQVAAKVLANATGPFGFFPVVLPPPFTLAGSVLHNNFFLACEQSQTCIVIGTAHADPSTFLCAAPLPADCVARRRPVGARRFQLGFGTIVDPTYDFAGHLALYRQQAISTIGLIFDSWAYTTSTYLQTQVLAQASAFTVSYQVQVPVSNKIADLNLTAEQIADDIVKANPGALIVQVSPNSPAAADVAAVMIELKRRGWTPKALSFGGGSDAILLPLMETLSDLDFSYGTYPWNQRLRGSGYHAVDRPGVNFEVWPANDTHDTPAVFVLDMEARWGPAPAATTYSTFFGGHVFAAVQAQALILAQKLLELTMVDNAVLMAQASASLSIPSLYHRLQLDPSGRIIVQDAIVTQTMPGSRIKILAPANIAEPATFPMPTWQDRAYAPAYAASNAEKAMLAVNSIVLAYVMLWLLFVIIRRNHPVIRASTPIFCGLIVSGCAMMVASNYFSTLYATDSHCAAGYWLFFLGFTLTYGSLFTKTFRIWKIFSSGKLVVQKIPTRELLNWVSLVLLADIIINAVWTGSGDIKAGYVQVDPWRPAKDYMTCSTSASAPYLAAHVALKGLMILAGMVLSYAVRKTPSLYNESVYIMISIYNIAVVSAFALPLIITSANGRETAFAIRAYAVMFIGAGTASVMFVPKWVSMQATLGAAGRPASFFADKVTKHETTGKGNTPVQSNEKDQAGGENTTKLLSTSPVGGYTRSMAVTSNPKRASGGAPGVVADIAAHRKAHTGSPGKESVYEDAGTVLSNGEELVSSTLPQLPGSVGEVEKMPFSSIPGGELGGVYEIGTGHEQASAAAAAKQRIAELEQEVVTLKQELQRERNEKEGLRRRVRELEEAAAPSSAAAEPGAIPPSAAS
jgi:hypothetical protein